jgi:hypothetical protein
MVVESARTIDRWEAVELIRAERRSVAVEGQR